MARRCQEVTRGGGGEELAPESGGCSLCHTSSHEIGRTVWPSAGERSDRLPSSPERPLRWDTEASRARAFLCTALPTRLAQTPPSHWCVGAMPRCPGRAPPLPLPREGPAGRTTVSQWREPAEVLGGVPQWALGPMGLETVYPPGWPACPPEPAQPRENHAMRTGRPRLQTRTSQKLY